MAAVGLSYGNSLPAIWTIDDDPNILQNPQVQIRELRPYTLFQTFFSPLHPDASGAPGLSRPIAYLSFALNWYFGQDSPTGYRLVNILIHALNACLLLLIIKGLLHAPNLRGQYSGCETVIALLTAALWALNPVQTQAVVYIVQRMASLACLFYLSAIWFYIRCRASASSAGRVGYTLLIIAAFVAALGSKENAAMLPASLTLLEFTFYQDWHKTSVKRAFPGLLAFGSGLILSGGLWLHATDRLMPILNYSIRLFSPWERLLTQPRILVFHLSQLFYPVPGRLSLVHDVEVSRSLIEPWTTLPAIVVVLGLIVFGIWQIRRRPLLSFAILFFFLNHVIESSIIGLELIYEHRNYLPSLFLFAPVAAGLIYLLSSDLIGTPRSRRLVVLFSILLPVGFGIGTYVRNLAWLDAKTFWEDAARKAPLSMRPVHNLAYYYYEKTGQHQKAFELYHAALDRPDTNRLILSLPHIKIAEHYERRGEFARAAEHLETALSIFPEFERIQFRLAVVRYRDGQLVGALGALAPLVDKRPGSFDCRFQAGKILLKMGRVEEARDQLESALRISPESDGALFMLGIAWNLGGRCDQAEGFLERVLQRHPGDRHVLLWLIDCKLQAPEPDGPGDYIRSFLEGVPVDRIEEKIRQTLAGGFMPDAARERLLQRISEHARLTGHPQTGGRRGAHSLIGRREGPGS